MYGDELLIEKWKLMPETTGRRGCHSPAHRLFIIFWFKVVLASTFCLAHLFPLFFFL
jgi:hypothetical protein